MILFDQITKTFSSGVAVKKVQAVKNINLSIGQGEIFGIVGPNGAGKSTMLKMLMGFIRPTSGRVTVMDKPAGTPEAMKNMGYLPENPYYYDHLSAEDLMRFSGTTSGMKSADMEKRIEYLLERMNLTAARKRKLRTYSKGMTQRAGICFSLVHDPDIVIFDEPMSGLDPLGRKLVVDLIFELKEQKKTVLFCSHILNDVERICDRMAIMDLGQLKALFSKNDIELKYGLSTVCVNTITDEQKEKLQTQGMTIEQEDHKTLVRCPKKKLTEIIHALINENIGIIEIASESNILENMFLDIIAKRESV